MTYAPDRSVSIFYYTGDFGSAIRNYLDGRAQSYHTHDEVARLALDLAADQFTVNLYSFVSPAASSEQPAEGVRVIGLGARDSTEKGLLSGAIREQDSDFLVVHFDNLELLRAAHDTRARLMFVTASSSNIRSPRRELRRHQLRRMLNSDRVEWAANHCWPATRQLHASGVHPDKLLAWNVPFDCDPADLAPKQKPRRAPVKLLYVGSVSESKGVGDLIRAVAMLVNSGTGVQCEIIGGGDVESMRDLASTLGVRDLCEFPGVVSSEFVSRAMGGADLIVIPSRWDFPEGLPLVLIEAIASRTPIVCSDHPMFTGVLVDGESACIFKAGSPQHLVDAIDRALERATYPRLSLAATKSWAALEGTVDYRSMILHWVRDEPPSAWLRSRTLAVRNSSSAPSSVTLDSGTIEA